MPYFVKKFWGKKLTKISLFKDISQNKKKFENFFFLPNDFLSQEISQKS